MIDHGVRLIDTASAYGTGHSERVIGRALAELPASVRDEIVVATKFGLVVDEQSRSGGGEDVSPEAIRRQCADSLRRLGRDRLDVLQLHGGADGAAGAEDVVATLEELVSEGKIRWFGTAQDTARGDRGVRPLAALPDRADAGQRVRLVDRRAAARP